MTSNTRSHDHDSPAAPRSRLAAEIMAIGAPLRDVVNGLEPRDVPVSWAPEVLAAFMELERLAVAGRILITARAVEAGQWQRERASSAAEWLAGQLGTTTGRARADIETSGRLDDLGATADAVRAGALSAEQAAAVADAATVNPEAEPDLLDRAKQDSLRRTRQEAERRKAEARSERERAERDARTRRERQARFSFRNGKGYLEASGPIADIAALEQRIRRAVDQRFRDERFREQRCAPGREQRSNYAFDALMDLGGEVTGAAGDAGVAAGEKATAAPADAAAPNARRPRRAPLTRLTMIRVDLAAIMRGSTEGEELCEIAGHPVSVAEMRRLLGDSLLHLVLTNGEAVIDVVNLGRKPTVAQSLAKLFTDSSCTVAGCDRNVRLEFDHRADWATVRVTELANLDLLCDHHHDLKTYEKWSLAPGSGRRPMVPPGEPPSPGSGPPPPTGPRPDTRPTATDHRAAPDHHAAPDHRAALAERLARIHRIDTERRERHNGQDRLFTPVDELDDTG